VAIAVRSSCRSGSVRAGAFITGSDILMDGGVTATYWYGQLSPNDGV
jgi:hypothetical protein